MTKILVVEDEKLVRDNILALLEAEDFETIAADNGKTGLQMAFTEIPDLILCDLMLPEIDGYGILKALREEPMTAPIPFIFLTARVARTDTRKGMDLGADDYLTKPFTRAELLGAITSRLTRNANLIKHFSTSSLPEKKLADKGLIEKHLRRLLQAEDFQQFQVYYQPQVDINSGRITGAESLFRWHHPELGLVSTSELINLAEATGLIVPISEWVLLTVFQQLKTWYDAGFTWLRIAVNLSAQQFIQKEFTQKIVDFLTVHNLQPYCLELELTESMILEDWDSAIATILELQSLGIKIALDDFGTGYTSLLHLNKLPINTLKIDRYFIQNIDKEPQKSAITTALIQMGHNLKLKIVAEGVETQAELDFLCEKECDTMQGFLFSCPLPASEFEKLLVTVT